MIEKWLFNGFNKTVVFSTQKVVIILKLFLFAILAFGFLLTGCQSAPEPMPRVDRSGASKIILPKEVDVWAITHPIEPASDVPANWYPPKAVEKNWTAIVVHHSATDTGNMAKFHKSHIEEHGWDGIGYDFVIGNGSDSGDGEIEVTYRWREQKTGAHCKTPDNWANEYGIGICLVGNFNNKRPTKRQMDSLVKLTDFLQKRYRIPQSKIYGHGDTPGAHVTDCPGNLFPVSQFKSSLNF